MLRGTTTRAMFLEGVLVTVPASAGVGPRREGEHGQIADIGRIERPVRGS